MTKSIQVDAEVLEITRNRGKDQPHLLDIGSPEARHSRSHDLTLMFQQDSIEAVKKIPETKKLIQVLKKEIEELRKITFKDDPKFLLPILKSILNRKLWIYSKILQKKEDLLKEYDQRILDFEFIDAMIGVRRRDEQVVADTHDEVGEVMIKTALRSGAQEKHDEIAKANNKKMVQKNLGDFDKKPRPEKKITKKKTNPKKKQTKKDKKEGYT